MAKKKSPAELKQEGVELAAQIAAVRKKPHNFALLMGKDGLFFETHLKKSPEILWRTAKKAGGGPKGVMGTVTAKGKIIEMNCLADGAPSSLPKLAKKHFAERGQPFKFILNMPGGTLSDGEDGEAPGEDLEPRRKALIAEFKKLAPDLKLVLDASDPETKKAMTAQAAEFTKQVKGEDLDRAEALLKELTAKSEEMKNKPRRDAGPSVPPPQGEKPGSVEAPQTGTPDAVRRAELTAEFVKLQPDLMKALASSNEGLRKKAKTLSDMFAQDMKAGNFDKAAKTLTLLKKTAQGGAKLPVDGGQVEGVKSIFDSIGEALGEGAAGLMKSFEETKAEIGDALDAAGDALNEAGEAIGDALEDLADGARDVLGILSEEDEANKDKVDDFGLSEDQQMVLVRAARDDPGAIAAALPVLEKIKTLKLPPKQFENLLAMSKSEPKAYEATVAAMANIDGAGAMDISVEAMTASLQKIETTTQKHREMLTKYYKDKAAQDKAEAAHKAAAKELADAKLAEQRAAAALKAYEDSLPADLSTLSEADRNAAVAESTRLINLHGDAKTATTAATTKEATAKTTLTTAQTTFNQTVSDYWAANTAKDQAIADNETLEDKRELVDAISFGPLSGDAKVPLDDEAKAKMIEAYGKSPDVGQEALNLIKTMDDPSVVVENVGAIVDRLNAGFADAKGKKLEVTKPDGTKGPPSDEASEAMAINALKLGASRGQEYFDGFNAYMDSGAQLKPDPCGGLDKEPGDLEAKDIDAAAQKRSAMVADGVIQGNGSVDFDSKKAKEAMDHVMFHPGSLMTYSPHGIDQIEKTQKLFTDDATKEKANEIIGDTELPDRGEPQRGRARRLIADTTGKSARRISDNDAKEAVLSAMMTPLSQGPVGSCFSTAPVRRLKETDPLKAMEAYSGIVNTGTVTMDDGSVYPANMSAHEGQNPLMRSWEYTIADAGANLDQSSRKTWDTGIALGDTEPAGKNLGGIKDLLDDPADWQGSGVLDPVTLEMDNGVEGRIKKAIREKFKYVYNAAPGSARDATSGGGDGRSTDGGYEIYYEGTLIN